MSGRRSVWQRHRSKLFFSSAILATLLTTGAVSLYLIKKWLLRQQLKISEQQFVKEQIKRRFTQTQQDALYTIYELIPVLSLVLAKDLDVEEIVGELKGKKLSRHLSQRSGLLKDEGEQDGLSSGMSTSLTDAQAPRASFAGQDPTAKSKAELWNELKLKSLTKLCTVIYSTSSLLLLTRLQLNILARREYIETAVKVAVDKESSQSSIAGWLASWWHTGTLAALKEDEKEHEDSKLSEKAQQSRRSSYINEQAFLSFSWWLLNRGWLQFKSLAEDLVERHFGDLNPRDMLTVEEFGDRLSSVLHAINQELLVKANAEQALQTILLPDPNLEQFVLQQTLDSEALKLLYEDNAILRQLLNETSKCIESTASLIVLESLVNDAFQFAMSLIADNVSKKSKQKPDQDNSEVPEPKYQMALFSITSKNCCDEMLKSGVVSMNNLFLQRLDSIAELDDLSASVYSNFGF
ncbi:LAQU0S10e02366g1_1 [Lachancea quebecensis]|uniref:Peroxin-3 n=1 Tax=Lachancea quebecensis TaxID=1654605 RepID=A0A0P1KU74_9SACH|nr:LAQU0S10e02366g1_1 [Lachancea quebecensis]